MPRITLSGYILVPEEDLESVLLERPVHRDLTRNEPGCLVFDILQDENHPQRFHVYEEFVNRAAFEAHQHRTKSSRWARVTSHVERHYIISEDD